MAYIKKKNYMSETKFLFAGLLGNYVTCCRSIFIVWKNAATVWLILTLSFCKGIVKDVVNKQSGFWHTDSLNMVLSNRVIVSH